MTNETGTPRSDPTADPLAKPNEAGAYVGRKPERQAETIPGGVRQGDERIAAHSSEAGATPADDTTASGHRDVPAADDDLGRDAGEHR